jgi:CheY-like chemotaxis protein
MRAKRALIVDDSKSARLFLSRILVQHAIEVETVESAEAAIEYLADHRPDVIFMDHQMPGMDGLQAVRIIKNNPVTATIPIMMYTSQEGELYLGQARALGAVGVMPKQIRQADVSKVLYELHLLADRRSRDPASMRPVSLDALAEAAVARGAPPAEPGVGEGMLREQLAEMRRLLVATIESQSSRIAELLRPTAQDAQGEAEEQAQTAPPRRGFAAGAQWPWVVAGIALLMAFASTLMWWREASLRQELAMQILARTSDPFATTARVEASQSTAEPAPAPSSSTGAADALAGDKPVVMSVPYGDNPLGPPRLDAIRQLFHRLVARKFRGVVDIRSFPGRFCLVGNATDGYSLAPDELLYARCDAVGNPDAAELAQREPLPFANLVGELRSSTKGAADVRVFAGDTQAMLVSYPEVTQHLTAGEWNRAAGTNNRLEIRLR